MKAPRGKPKRREQSGASVIGAAPAEACDKALHSRIEQDAYQLAEAPRASPLDGVRRGARVGESHDLRALDDRGIVRDLPVGRIDRSARRAADPRAATLSPGAEHGVERTFAAVGHRTQSQLGVVPDTANASRDRVSGFGRRHRALERVRRDDDDG